MTRLASVLAAAVLVAAAVGAQAPAAPRKTQRLVAFPSCSALTGYAKKHMLPYVTAYGIGGSPGGILPPGVVAPATSKSDASGAAYSGTNVQEPGVDEPDLVKTDGSTIFAVENGRIESVRAGGGAPKLLDTLNLPGGWSRDLLLDGNRLLVLSRAGGFMTPLSAQPATIVAPIAAQTTVTEVDVSDPSALKVVQTLTIDGAYIDARAVGSSVRLVTSTGLPVGIKSVTPQGTDAAALDAAKTRNRAAVANASAAAWLPRYRLGKRAARPLVSCRNVRHASTFTGLGMLTVTTVDLAKGLAPVDSTAVMSDGRIVYASPTSLYVTTEPWAARPLPAAPTVPPANPLTQIHAFDISNPDKTTYEGSGTVPGYLLNQFSLSESAGVLRVVSTDAPAWVSTTGAGSSESFLTTLRADGGSLQQVGQVGGLGQGQRVYAVRMLGDRGYVVTFRQVDPLYVLDLGSPAHPRVAGKLELPGYSAYLHPITGDLLLGVGAEVDASTNEPSGTQVSLFDVGDPAHPKRLAHAVLGQGWSAVESDHHAFLYWPPASLAVVPFGQQAVAMHVARSGISELGRVVHTNARQATLPLIDRAVVVGRTLYTVSSGGVAANALATFAAGGWVAFPAAPPQPQPGPIPIPSPGPPVK